MHNYFIPSDGITTISPQNKDSGLLPQYKTHGFLNLYRRHGSCIIGIFKIVLLVLIQHRY